MRLKSFILYFVAAIFLISSISAFPGYCANSYLTSVEPSSVGADEDFTVGIVIDNCGDKLPDTMTFEISRHSSDIKIKEPLLTEIGKMGYSNSKRFILYNMHTAADIAPGEHFFETTFRYGGNDMIVEQKDNFSVIVNTQKPDLAISRIYTNPELILEGDKIILTIDLENAGNGEAKDVRLELENLNLNGIKQKYLGRIKSDENIPARFVFEEAKEGIYEGKINVFYKFAGKEENLNFPFKIQVFSKGKNYFYLLGGIFLIGLFGYFFYQKKLNIKK